MNTAPHNDSPATQAVQSSRPDAMNDTARQALRLAMRVLDLAEASVKPHTMCQAQAQVARCLMVMKDFDSAEAYLGKALGSTRLIPGVDARVDLLCELAEVTASLAESKAEDTARYAALERSRDHAFEAARLAGQTTDSHWEIKVLLRISDVLNRCGDHDDATHMQERAITLLGLRPIESADSEPLAEGLRALAPSQLM